MSVLIIQNPMAGYHQPAWREPVLRILAPLGPVECVVPGSPDGATAAAREAEARGVELIVAAGGDGTVHRVVNGLSSVETHVGLLPLGTANDLATYLGVPRSPIAAAQAMLAGVTMDIDVIRINHRRVLTVAGAALVAEAALLADAMKRRYPWLGTMVYTLAAARVIAARGHDALAGVFIANQSTLGGHMRLPCVSMSDDGVCEIVTLAGGSRLRLTRTLLAMTLGSPMPKDALSWTSLARTTLAFDRDVPLCGDGEDLGVARELQISVESAAVRVRIARAAASEGTFAVQAGNVNVMAISSATE